MKGPAKKGATKEKGAEDAKDRTDLEESRRQGHRRRRGGREIRKTAVSNPIFFSMLMEVTNGNISPVLGGVLIRSGGEIVGAVGITGDTAENDESCAIAGIAASGLQAAPGPE